MQLLLEICQWQGQDPLLFAQRLLIKPALPPPQQKNNITYQSDFQIPQKQT